MRATRPSLLLLSRATLFNPFYWGPQGHHYYYCQGLPSQNKVYCFALYFIELELETNTGSYSWCHRGSWHHMIIFHKKQDCRKMLYLKKKCQMPLRATLFFFKLKYLPYFTSLKKVDTCHETFHQSRTLDLHLTLWDSSGPIVN